MNRAIVLAALGLLLASPATAQYFGRNKVQYETFKFQVLRTAHFDVYFYPEEREAARHAARMAERWYVRLSSVLGHELSSRQPLILYADHPDFEQTNVLSDQPSEGTGGVTESLKRRIILPLAAGLAETDHVLGHELVHAFQYDITGVGRGNAGTGLNRLPLWFIEGMAEYLSVGPEDPHTAMWMRDAVRRNDLPDLDELSNPRFFPYRYGQAFWAYVGGTYGDSAIGIALRAGAKSGELRSAIGLATGANPEDLVTAWHSALRAAAQPVAAATATPLTDSTKAPQRADSGAIAGSRHVAGGGGDVRLFLAPALSPDGSRVVYMSEAGLFSIELFLADAATGKPIRKLVSSTRDPHLESLQFINSAGAWDPSGRRIALGTVIRGKPALHIVNADDGDVELEVPFPTLGEIFNPTWSPDGNAIAFSAQVGGVTDLFIYHLSTKRLERLTNDVYADLQPAWSPDGRQIAFVTDRFGTSVSVLDYGNYRLALFDLTERRPVELRALPVGKHINPQWSPDGRRIFFLGDMGAITNIYRLDLAASAVTQVTNLYSGASGITPLSPALTVAQRSGRAMFTVYTNDGYVLQAIDDWTTLAGTTPRQPPAHAGMLPPVGRAAGGVMAQLADPRTGLPAQAFDSLPYRAGISLDMVAQPSLAVGADRFGTYFGGGATLFWSDILGDHNLITAAQFSGTFDLNSFAALVGYENRKSRFNWGIAAQQSPYAVGRYASYTQTINGQPALVEDLEIRREINREVSLRGTYPLSRSHRIELWTGARHISYEHELERRAVNSSGRTVLDTTITFPSPQSLTLGTASAALVHDNSFFGATSPVLGERWRLEASPTFGTISFVTALVDYRRYFMPVRPFTLAGRLMHVGRYGPDAEDTRLSPMYLGYPHLVRGYDYSSFTASECGAAGAGAGCPVYDQLLGSRIVVANAELRFPLFGVLGVGDGFYGPLPIEAALFYDAGLAWGQSVDGRTVMSAGATLRMNLFGFAIAQLDLVHPFQRPDRDWMVRFSLTQGF